MRYIRFALCFLALSLTALASQAADMPFVQRRGARLVAGDKTLFLLGVNRYELAGGPQAAQCQHWGGDEIWWKWASAIISQASSFGSNVVRLWAFQNFTGPTGRDFSQIDKVVKFAKSKGVRVILTLENQWADCTQGGIKDAQWFGGGYKQRYGYPLSFVDYVKAIVERYKDEPAVAMWEIINEGKLYQQPAILKKFLVDTAALIRSIDKRHLIAGGAAIQCWQGKQGAVDFESFQDDSNLQVVTAHDYDEDQVAWTGCMQSAILAARHFDKPFFIGEAGIKASSFGAAHRASLFDAKIKATAAKKASGYLIWSINLPSQPVADGFDYTAGDPTAGCLLRSRFLWGK